MCTVQNIKKRIIFSLPVLCSPRLILTRSPQISDQNKSVAREPEGLVKITYGIVASSLFKRAGNSNYEDFLNCDMYHFLTEIKGWRWTLKVWNGQNSTCEKDYETIFLKKIKSRCLESIACKNDWIVESSNDKRTTCDLFQISPRVQKTSQRCKFNQNF